MKEEELIEACKQGSASAQKALYQRFAPKMYRLCFRYVKEEMEAEDLMVKGFMKVFTGLEKFESQGEGSLESWVKRIMINESLMYLRRNINFNLVATTQAHGAETEELPDGQLAAEEIYAMVLELPPGYRTVFNLYAIEGYSHKEIALQLGISENTSKSQLSKARNALKILLAKNGMHYER